MSPRRTPLSLALLALPLLAWSPAHAADEPVIVLAEATPAAAPKAAPVVERRIVVTRVGQDGTPLPPPPLPPIPPIPPLPGNVEVIRLHSGPAGLPDDDPGTAAFVDGEFGPGNAVTGQPFSAEAVSEKVQTLADGNRIVRKTTTRLYRDGQGRKRYEMLGEDGNVRTVFLYDPVSKLHYTLNPAAKSATKLSMLPQLAAMRAAEKASEGARKADIAAQKAAEAARSAAIAAEKAEKQVHVERRVVVVRDANGVQTRIDSGEPAPADGLSQPIASKELEGVKVDGTRRTRTIAAGTIGNEKPIQVVSERWYSPELKVVMATSSSDPRYGTSSYRLSKVKRGEPDAALFAPPVGYKVHDIMAKLPKPPVPPAPPASPRPPAEARE